MTGVDDKAGTVEQWRALIRQLSDEKGAAALPIAPAPAFDDASARKRVGVVITKAMLGEPMYRLYQLYCGDPSPQT